MVSRRPGNCTKAAGPSSSTRPIHDAIVAAVNWAKLITCKMADLTREDQPRGNGIAGNDGLAGIGVLPEVSRDRLLEAYLKPPLFHGLEPT
jgi:hypothetical protein